MSNSIRVYDQKKKSMRVDPILDRILMTEKLVGYTNLDWSLLKKR